MLRSVSVLFIGLIFFTQADAQSMSLSTSSNDYQISNVFGNVDFFMIVIEFNEPLTPGVYIDPDIVSVTYQVTGELAAGTPSGFPAFDLQRDITGADFYAQGSSLSFEIAQFAVLSDGVQAAELVGNAPILTFNGREVDNGRFHPALLELNANGTGRIQNSDNVPSLNPLLEVNFGDEYITDLVFDPGNTTLITGVPAVADPRKRGGSGANSLPGIAALILVGAFARSKRHSRRRQEV